MQEEVRAWTIQRGMTAPQAAGQVSMLDHLSIYHPDNHSRFQIHTDFEKGFVAAEVISYDDLRACGSEAAVKVSTRAESCCKVFPHSPTCSSGGWQTKTAGQSE